jgi:hypothetical protein
MSIQLLLDLGFVGVFSRYFSYAKGGLKLKDMYSLLPEASSNESTSWETIRQLIQLTKTAYFYLALIAFLFSVSFGTFLSSKSLNASSYPIESWLGWFFVVFASSLTVYGNVYVSFIQGMGKVALVQRFQMFTSLFSIISGAVSIIIFENLLILVMVYYFWFIINLLINHLIYRRLSRPAFKESAKVIKEDQNFLRLVILPNTFKTGIGMLTSNGLIQVGAVIISRIEKASTSAEFFIVLQLARAISSFSQAPFYSKIPSLSEMFVKKELYNKFSNTAVNAIYFSLICFIIFSLIVGLLGDWIFAIINSPIEFPILSTWIIFTLAFFAERIGASYLQLFTITGVIKWHIANTITALLTLSLSLLLYNPLGLIGLPIAMLVSNIAFYIPYCLKLCFDKFGSSIFIPRL